MNAPLMKQYSEMKKKHPDAVLLFRLGDFYECLNEDAVVASSVLGITLTRRATGNDKYIELAGFPHHALDRYLSRLVRAGKRVAICEQLEDPKLQKKLVKRGIPTPISEPTYDFMPIFLILSDLFWILNKLHIFEEIRLKTQELKTLAVGLGISPRRAFEECYEIKQSSLFD